MAKGSTGGKNPSVEFFFNDWHGGTMTMSRHQKGCYIDLLTAQFNNGHLSLDEVRNVLGNDFAAWQGILQKKFAQDSDGRFFNVRLDFQIKKKGAYNKSRESNLGSNGGDSPPHMDYDNGLGSDSATGFRGSAEGEIHPLQKFISENYPTVSKLSHQITYEECQKLDSLYSKQVIERVLNSMENYKQLLKKYSSVFRTLLNWCEREIKPIPINGNKPFTSKTESASAINDEQLNRRFNSPKAS